MASRGGRFIGEANGGDSDCFVGASPRPSPVWLDDAVGYRIDGEDRLLLDRNGQTVARLFPGAHPTAGPNHAASYASPPVVTSRMRASFDEPAPVPAGLQPASAEQLMMRWLPTGPKRGNDKAYLEFLRSGRWTASDGCNGQGGKYALGADGELLTTSGASTLIGCDGSPVGNWATEARRAALDGEVLVLLDASGREIGRCKRA